MMLHQQHQHGTAPQLRSRRRRQRRTANVVVVRAQQQLLIGRRGLLSAATACGCSCGRCGVGDALFANAMASGMREYEAAVRPLKQRLFQAAVAAGPAPSSQSSPSSSSSSSPQPLRVLDVGIGTGPNLGLLADAAAAAGVAALAVTGLEPNRAMWGYAREAAAAAGLPDGALTLVEGSVGGGGDQQQQQHEEGEEAALLYDAAVVTLVLCSVADPGAALADVARRLRPGGRMLLVEHVAASGDIGQQVAQHVLEPLQRLLADNCHLTRRTGDTVRGAARRGLLRPLPLADALGLSPSSAGEGGGAGAVAALLGPGVRVDAARSWGAGGGEGDGGEGDGLLHFVVQDAGLIAPHVAGVLVRT